MPETPALSRWWREPWWARLLLALILVGFAVLTVWNLGRGVDFAFYEASARSMSESWRALLFGAFDPAATVTLDKLSGFALPQALSVRLFGMSTAALALPQVVEGLVTVFACALIGLRWIGRTGGLVAAAAAAATPIFVSMFAHPMEDGLLTMALAVALVWWQRAMLTARWWPLLLTGLFIGIGFQAKMAQAWLPLPALLVGTLLTVGGSWGRRVGRAALLAGASIAVSLSWMLVIQLSPAASRPFVDGSTDNDVFAMVFGYNGIDRILPNAVAGAVQSAGGTSTLAGEIATFTKLFAPENATQIGWLYPVALAGLLLGLLRWAPRRTWEIAAPGERPRRGLFVALALWLLASAAVISAARMPHAAYLAALGVPLALLGAFAVSEAGRLRRSASGRARWVLPVVVVPQAAWAVLIVTWGETPAPLAIPIVAVSALGAAAVVLDALVTRSPGRARSVVTLAALAAVLIGPTLSSAQALDAARAGSGTEAYVGIKPARGHATPETFAISSPDPWGGAPQTSLPVTQLLDAVRAAGGGHDGTALFLTDSWSLAAAVIDATGEEVLADGGYSGQAPVFTTARVRELIADGVHLVVVRDGARAGDAVAAAVRAEGCHALRAWPGQRDASMRLDSRSGGRDAAAGAGAGFTLFSCSGAASADATPRSG